MLRYALPLFLIAAPAAAQRVDEQLWLQATASTPLAEDVSLTLDGVARFSDRAGGTSDTQFGGMIGHDIGGGVEIAIGYRHLQDYDQGRALPNEERLRQQIALKLGGGFSARTRLEQTFSEAGPGAAWRWRQQLRFSRPVGMGLSAFVNHESFINLNDRRQRSGYDRMRNTIGLQIPLSTKLRGEAGYLNQYRFGRAGGRDTMDHVASFALTLSL